VFYSQKHIMVSLKNILKIMLAGITLHLFDQAIECKVDNIRMYQCNINSKQYKFVKKFI